MQNDLEQRLISISNKDEKTFGEILTKGISTEDFVIYTEVFEFVKNYYFKYNSIPAKSVVTSTFPGFSFVEDVDKTEIKFLCDELSKANVKRKAISIINDTEELLMIDTYGAIDSLVTRLSSIKRIDTFSRSFADNDSLKRYKKIIENKERIAKGITVGIKTGISLFDDKYLGWQPGNLIGIVGRLGIGKSWIAEYLGCQAYNSGKRVLYLSPEMSTIEVELRWDTIMGTLNGHTFLNDKLQTGEVDLKEYKKWLEEISTRKDWLTLSSLGGKSFTISNITGLINEFSPDLVVVDGIALLDDVSKETWQKVMNISYGLKSIAQNHNLVIVVTAQANRGVGDEMPKPNQVAFGDSFLQACDFGIMLQQDINRPDIRFITIPKVRTGGKPVNTPIEIKFQVNAGVLEL